MWSGQREKKRKAKVGGEDRKGPRLIAEQLEKGPPVKHHREVCRGSTEKCVWQ